MKNSKLINLIYTFSNKEIKAFRCFLESPYFNKKEELVFLFKYIKNCLNKEFSLEMLNRKTVYIAVAGDKTYNDKHLNHIMSQLFQLAEHFLSIQNFEKDGIMPDYYLLEAYVERKQGKSFGLAYNRANKKLKETPFRDEKFFFQTFLLADIADQQFQSTELRQYDQNLEKASERLDRFFFSKKLKYLTAMISWEKIISRPFNKTLINEIKDIVTKYKYTSTPQINIYYKLLLLLTEPASDKYFESLKVDLGLQKDYFPQKEMKLFYYFMINYCIIQIREGKNEFADELLQIYTSGIKNGALFEEGQITPWTFKNMIRLGIGQKEYAWTQNFISEYSYKLPSNKQKDAYNFSMADMFYAQNKYDEALNYLNQVEFTDIHYSLDAKELLLKIYYTAEETEAFLSLIFSFKIYLKRNKLITKDVKTAYENFIRFIHQMHKYGASKKDTIEHKIKDTKSLVARGWLLEQVKDL